MMYSINLIFICFRAKKLDADLDLELDEYEPSDLDDDYDENEKMLLEKAAKRNSKFDEVEEDSEV